MPGIGNRGVLLAAIGAALLFAISVTALRPTAPLTTDAPAAAFSASRAFENLKDVIRDGAPHPLGSAANTRTRAVIVAKLSSLGYKVELQSGWVCNPISGCGHPTNIIATRDGARHDPTRGVVLLSAHYDSVAAGPGASDDGVGVAVSLEIARILADGATLRTRNAVVILLSDGEEAGLLGAMLFVRDHPLAKAIIAAVNMDSRGTSGQSLMFETGSANQWLMNLYSRSIDHPRSNSLYYVLYKLLPNNTDFSVFKAAGYQGFNFAFIANTGFYHTPLDDLTHASLSTIQDQGHNALQALRALEAADDLNPPVADSVFFDVWGLTLVVWPAKPMLCVTLCLWILSGGAVTLLLCRGRTRWQEIAWGLMGIATHLLLAATLSLAAILLLLALGKAPPYFAGPWLAHPAAMSVAAVAIPVFAASLTSNWLAQRAGYWGLWSGGILIISALAAGVAWLNPGPGFPWVLAAAAANISVLPALAVPSSKSIPRWSLEIAALLPGLVCLAVLMPMLLLLYAAVGALAWPPMSLALGLAASFLMPLLAVTSEPLRRSGVVSTAGIALGGFLITLLLPTFSQQWPQRINVEYWFDADTRRAHWWVQPGSLHLPAAMAAVARFDSALQPRFPGISQLGFMAPAPDIAFVAPQSELISSGKQHWELRLRPPTQVDKLLVVFPADARVHEAVLNTPEGALPAQLLQLAGGATALVIHNAPPAGMSIGLDSAVPLSARVLALSYGLPRDLSQGAALVSARPENATSSQDGDVTVIGSTVR
jgi:hypothetical protein